MLRIFRIVLVLARFLRTWNLYKAKAGLPAHLLCVFLPECGTQWLNKHSFASLRLRG